jgi:phosphoribosylanthranilate isomerase
MVGLVSAMPTGPGAIPDEKIAELAGLTPPGVTPVLLTCLTDPAAIAEQARRCRVQAVQLVDEVPRLAELRCDAKLIQVIHVEDERALEQAAAAAEIADALLLDSGAPSRRELGGTGRVHDWELSRAIVERSRVPVWLAGGLNASNLAEAVARVRPFGVDVCSGVRSDGRLDGARLRDFFAVLTSADSARRENR